MTKSEKMQNLANMRWAKERNLSKEKYEQRIAEGKYIPVIPDRNAHEFHKKHPKQEFVMESTIG